MSLLLLLACNLPAVSLPPQGAQATGLVLLVHGSQEDSETWAVDLAEEYAGMLPQAERWDVVAYDWSDGAGNRLTAAGNAHRHGQALGYLLNHDYDYEQIQVISHSAGAHVGDGLASTWTGPTLQLTFLDPFGGRGLLNWGYGRRHFGEGATWADCVFNADDGVPSTEQAPELTHGFDVTPLRPADYADEEGHWWPIEWYADSEGSGRGLDLALPMGGRALWPDYPVGTTTTVR